MVGPIAQHVALVAHGNHFLRKGELAEGFYPRNSTFQFCSSIEFWVKEKSFFFAKPKDTSYANDPTEWMERLRNDRCTELRLHYLASKPDSFAKDHQLAGMVGGGGTWIQEAVFPGHSIYSADQWSVTDPHATDRRIWSVRYIGGSKDKPTIKTSPDLEGLKGEMVDVLGRIAEFAQLHNLLNWAETFNAASAALHSSNPVENFYHKDLVPTNTGNLFAKQLLISAGTAWVFGGMGSWNDVGFDKKEDENEYEELSVALYSGITRSIVAAVNSL